MADGVKKFFLRGAAFVLPPVLLWVGAVAKSHEATHVDAVISRQIADTSMIYGPAYSMNNHYYRAAFTRAVQPETLIIGDSRVSLARSWFFNKPEAVYNACWGGITPAEVQYFLENQPEGSIKTLIFSVSHFDFNHDYLAMEYPRHAEHTDPAFGQGQNFWGAGAGVLSDWKEGRLSLLELLAASKQRYGVSAVKYGAGILTDGSFFSAEDNRNHEAQTAHDPTGHLGGTLRMIEEGLDRFRYGDAPNEAALGYMEQLLAYCEARGIHVIAFLPPYAPTVNAALEEKRELYGYHFALAEALQPLFWQHGFEFYDYTDVAALGCDDSYFVDGYHAGDVVWVRMMADMAKQGSALGQLCDTAALQALDAQRHANYTLFETLEEYQAPLPKYS